MTILCMICRDQPFRSGVATNSSRADVWTPIVPVPDNAGPPNLAGASGYWAYRDSEKRLLFYTVRFDPSGRNKVVLPYTFCESPDGKREWRWQGVEGPRPLYGLDRLSPWENEVLVVEGEKTADAATRIFAELALLTSCGGAESACHSDWSALRQRDVVIWPDHDEKGASYAEDVARLAREAGATSVKVVRVPAEFPENWDLADPLPNGITEETLRRMLDSAEPAALNSLWPEPDRSILNEDHRPVPLPLDVFGPWREWVETAAEGASAPTDYVGCSLLAGAAAIIGNARWVSPWEGWAEPPALWMALVGKPASGKSPGLRTVMDILRQIESDLSIGYGETVRRWETEKEAARCEHQRWEEAVRSATEKGTAAPLLPEAAVEPEKPARPRHVVNDTTPEALYEVLRGQPRGVLTCRDELSGWLGSFDRYGKGSGERSFWLEGYEGREFIADRVKRDEPLRIPHLTVSVLGGIQPDKLASTFIAGDDDGLTARFLVSWPEPVGPRRPKNVADREVALRAFRRLQALVMLQREDGTIGPKILQLSRAAADMFEKLWVSNHAATNDAGGKIAGHFGKYGGFLVRIALVLELLWWSRSDEPEPEEISRDAVAAAANILNGYFRPMAERAYGDAAVPEVDRLAATLARWIMRNQPDSINISEIARKARLVGLRDASKVKLAVAGLTDGGWLRASPSRQGGTTGRNRDDHEVNPRLYHTGREQPSRNK